MENYAGNLLVGAVVGIVATRFIPARQHEARGIAFLAALLGGLLAGEMVTALGAPLFLEWLTTGAGAVAAAVSIGRSPRGRAASRRYVGERPAEPASYYTATPVDDRMRAAAFRYRQRRRSQWERPRTPASRGARW